MATEWVVEKLCALALSEPLKLPALRLDDSMHDSLLEMQSTISAIDGLSEGVRWSHDSSGSSSLSVPCLFQQPVVATECVGSTRLHILGDGEDEKIFSSGLAKPSPMTRSCTIRPMLNDIIEVGELMTLYESQLPDAAKHSHVRYACIMKALLVRHSSRQVREPIRLVGDLRIAKKKDQRDRGKKTRALRQAIVREQRVEEIGGNSSWEAG
ncbi:MAG: hypothetical protein SGPRY_006300, partial [Prymnesium sp.]